MIHVVMPTVPGREHEARVTLAQWERIGVKPTVLLQEEPPSPEAHQRTMKRAAGMVDGGLLFAEDDIDLSSSMPRWLERLEGCDLVVTLYLPGIRFYGAHQRRRIVAGLPAEDGIWPVRGFSGWFGSQAVYLPSDVAKAFAVSAHRPGYGGDLALRDWMLEQGLQLYYAAPNPVQHRAPRSATCPRFKPHRSRSYVG
jgi:hypothetical protein